jgi:phospholipase C
VASARVLSLSTCISVLMAIQPLSPALAGQSGTPTSAAASFLAAHERAVEEANARAATPGPRLTADQVRSLVEKKIKYIFVIYQENRSFDSYFGTFPGADGLFSQPASKTPGFVQAIVNTDGSAGTISPFRIGPREYAADTDDVDHSHNLIVEKMDVHDGVARMDHFAVSEERKYSPFANPPVSAKQFGELAMAYEDCDTVPLLWAYADRFVLFDHIFQSMTGPSTPGNLAIIGAQTGETQWALHPEMSASVPLFFDPDPFWGSPQDKSAHPLPANPLDKQFDYPISPNLTFATLPLSTLLSSAGTVTKADSDADDDLRDVHDDVAFLSKLKQSSVGFGWYQEGFDREDSDTDGPTDASGTHASYITHHNGPQYFGYVANNDKLRSELHGLGDFFRDLKAQALPKSGGVYFVKGGYINSLGMKPADPNPMVQRNFLGDDDHPAYSDAQISEALVARTVNAIAASAYWPRSAIIITWDDSEGDYDHVPPPISHTGPDKSIFSYGPRVPLILISPYAKLGYISHDQGSHGSVVKFVDQVFGLPPLALLPDELLGRYLGKVEYGQNNLGPDDALTPNITDLLDAFSPARLTGAEPAIAPAYVTIDEPYITTLPEETGLGCQTLGIVPTDRRLGIANHIPADFNPRPMTIPTH